MPSTRRIRSAGESLDLAPACSRRLRPTTYRVLDKLHSAGATIAFNGADGGFYIGSEKVHPRTMDALAANSLVVRDPGLSTPTYRVSARGESVLRAIEAQHV
jgi:hypothetical protein